MFNKHALKTELSDVIMYNNVNFVLYSINNLTTNPFLTIYLCKCSTGQLVFPIYPYNNKITETSCTDLVKKLLFDYDKYINDICYSGYINNENLYVFYEIKWNTYEAEYLDISSFIFPVLMDEILNQHCIYNISIHYEVTTFFINQSDIVYLIMEDTKLPIDYPIVTYRLDMYKKIKFMSIFGVSKDLNGEFGPYFYFKSYNSNIEEATKNKRARTTTTNRVDTNDNESVENIKNGILRCAVFTDNMTLYPDEFIDSDMDMDTLYNKGVYVIKKLQNHIPLTYHYINKIYK